MGIDYSIFLGPLKKTGEKEMDKTLLSIKKADNIEAAHGRL
jgi:hypothetical protein